MRYEVRSGRREKRGRGGRGTRVLYAIVVGLLTAHVVVLVRTELCPYQSDFLLSISFPTLPNMFQKYSTFPIYLNPHLLGLFCSGGGGGACSQNRTIGSRGKQKRCFIYWILKNTMEGHHDMTSFIEIRPSPTTDHGKDGYWRLHHSKGHRAEVPVNNNWTIKK